MLEIFNRETAGQFVTLNSWYPIPQGLHKVLVHSAQVIKEKPVPKGLFSRQKPRRVVNKKMLKIKHEDVKN